MKKGGDKPSSAFASKTKRNTVDKELGAQEAGDPGAYDPYTLKELAHTSKKSFSKSMRAGSGGFGPRENRVLNIELLGEATPGPGAYNGDAMMRTGKKANLAALDSGEKMPMSSFKSTSSKTVKVSNEHVPGAGAYTPNHSAIEKQPMNPANSLKGKGSRFKGADAWERAQAAEPGPGAYETEILRTGGRSALSAYDTGEMMASAAFASDSMRDLPWPTAAAPPKAAAAPTS